MTVLANALSAADTVMNLGAALDVGNYPAPYTIGSEAILVTGGDNTKSPSILRGQNGTASAAHAAGTSLTSGWGGGSGAIAATDGSTTVDPATTIQFPPGTLSDLGGGTAGVGLIWSLAGPFTLAFDTPDFVNPEDNGPVVFTVPAGSVFRIFGLVTTIFNQPCAVTVSAGESSVENLTNVWATSDITTPNNTAWVATEQFVPLAENNAITTAAGAFVTGADNSVAAIAAFVQGRLLDLVTMANSAAPIAPFNIAIQDSVVVASCWPTGTSPTAGSFDIYVLLATPAS